MTGEPETCAADALLLPPTDLAGIVGHLRQALPNEGVGLLATESEWHNGRLVAQPRKFYPGFNIRASPIRYELDPHELVAALRDIDAHGWTLGAIVHSHPHGPATPSPTDLAEFLYPEALMVIASFASIAPVVCAWRLDSAGEGWMPRQVPILGGIG